MSHDNLFTRYERAYSLFVIARTGSLARVQLVENKRGLKPATTFPQPPRLAHSIGLIYFYDRSFLGAGQRSNLLFISGRGIYRRGR